MEKTNLVFDENASFSFYGPSTKKFENFFSNIGQFIYQNVQNQILRSI